MKTKKTPKFRRNSTEKLNPAPDRFVALKRSNPELVPLPDEEADEDSDDSGSDEVATRSALMTVMTAALMRIIVCLMK